MGNRLTVDFSPTADDVRKSQNEWRKLTAYVKRDEALQLLFTGEGKKNTDLLHVLLKCSVLNDFYSTRIFDTYSMAVHICDIKDIDQRLEKGDSSLVAEIGKISLGTNQDVQKNFYSFATKYCSHHNPEEFAIYDSYVDKMLRAFRNTHSKLGFINNDLKDYEKFMEIYGDFKDKYGLKFSYKELDHYLWMKGRSLFNNNTEADASADSTDAARMEGVDHLPT